MSEAGGDSFAISLLVRPRFNDDSSCFLLLKSQLSHMEQRFVFCVLLPGGSVSIIAVIVAE